MVVEFLPTLRAMIAKTLIEKHKLTQSDAASKLGVTQSAVSQYRRSLRGNSTKLLDDKTISEEIENFASKLVSDDLDIHKKTEELYHVCAVILRKKYSVNIDNCPICNRKY